MDEPGKYVGAITSKVSFDFFVMVPWSFELVLLLGTYTLLIYLIINVGFLPQSQPNASGFFIPRIKGRLVVYLLRILLYGID